MTDKNLNTINRLTTPQTTTNLIVPPTWGDDINQALLDGLMSLSDDELKKMWDEIDTVDDEEENEIEQDKSDNMYERNEQKMNNYENIWYISWNPVDYDKNSRIVKLWWEEFDLNPFEWKLAFMSKVQQYAWLFDDEVRNIMIKLNI